MLQVEAASENEDENELWFALIHTHDKGAVASSWKYLLPWFFENTDNTPVTKDETVTDDRGIHAIEINPD